MGQIGREPPMLRITIQALIVAVCMALGGSAQAFDHNWGNAGGWQIGWPNGTDGCAAWGQFKGGTAVRLTVTDNDVFLDLFNTSWNFVRDGEEYQGKVSLDDGRNLIGNFTGGVVGTVFILSTKLPFDVLRDFGNASGMKIYLGNDPRPFEGLSLKGTTAALNSMSECLSYRRSQTPTVSETKGGAAGPKDTAGSGTGIIVSKQGYILTADHVVKGCSSIHVTQDKDIAKTAFIYRADEINDVAVLRIPNTEVTGNSVTIRVGPPVKQGEDIAVYGFPLAGALSSTGNIVSGNVTSLAGLADDVRYLQISAPVQPGNSGGPLIDTSGALVGIVTSRLSDVAMAQLTGNIPQNVNFAIKAGVVTNFLDVHSVPYDTVSSGSAKPLPDLADEAKGFTVLITCP